MRRAVYEQLIHTVGPRMEWLDNLASIQFSYDKAAYLNTVRQMIKIDPSPARYKALLFNLKNQNMSDQARLALFQLMRQTGNLTEAADVQDMAKLVDHQRSAGPGARRGAGCAEGQCGGAQAIR